ncbi:hypothetical protein HJC23_000680 [Cyclotella cryptica]|uniref:Uncharacterized protein n=1 Tax=Cyclotella cryptica TaxID=29204 RepID=A0ABD3QA49_9STRA
MFNSIGRIYLLLLLSEISGARGFGITWLSRGAAAFPFQSSLKKKSFFQSSQIQSIHPRHHERDCELAPDNQCSGSNLQNDSSRRSFIKSASFSFAGIVSSGPLAALLRLPQLHRPSATYDTNPFYNNDVASAMGLVTFPCPKGSLANTYHLMRAGQSLLEEKNILSTNPLFLTNRDDALTTEGVIQVEDACSDMMLKDINPSVVKYSLASKCIDTANIVATRMMVGRNRIIPEFTFMDPRGVGIWNGGSNEAAIWALDYLEAGVEGRGGRPPPNDDGTANETLHEQMIRLRQLMSILETQYSGDSILLIFPDGTSPALLSCLIAGIPLKDVHALNFEPGEVRLDVTMDSSLQLFEDKLSSSKYREMLDAGQQQLEFLRNEQLAREAEENAKPKPVAVSNPKPTTKVATKRLDLSEDGPDIYSVGALGIIAYMSTLRKAVDESSHEEPQAKSGRVPTLAFANSTGTTSFEFDTMPSATFEMSTGATTLRTHSMESNTFEEVPVLSKEERIKAADKAMEEYLSKDDGCNDWLHVIKDIINE